jgi:hypothetical protein
MRLSAPSAIGEIADAFFPSRALVAMSANSKNCHRAWAQQRHRQNDCEIALTRKNALLAGHEDGAENWAILASLIETAKLSNIDPKPGLPINRLDELLS